MTVVKLISLRNHLLTHWERQFIAGSTGLSPYWLFIVLSVASMIMILGLVGTWYLFTAQEWVWPWTVADRHPMIATAALLFSLWTGYKIGFAPLRSARVKLNKLINNTATKADIDAWTMEVVGQVLRTANNDMPKIWNDLTLESTMADATFSPPKR